MQSDFLKNVLARITRYETITGVVFRPPSPTCMIDLHNYDFAIECPLDGNAEKEEEIAIVAWTSIVGGAMEFYFTNPALEDISRVLVITNITKTFAIDEEDGTHKLMIKVFVATLKPEQ